MTDPYNPLDKASLAKSIKDELLARPAVQLSQLETVSGAGVYSIYYSGNFSLYRRIAQANSSGKFQMPIYVGKAVPKGARKGGLTESAGKGTALRSRLREHRASLDQVSNLESDDFFVRYLVVDDIWIPLGENVLIESFKPLWNRAVDGFGNKAPGRRRVNQFKSPWDVLHPGRPAFMRLADNPALTPAFVQKRVTDYLSGRPLDPLPREVLEEQEVQEALEDAGE